MTVSSPEAVIDEVIAQIKTPTPGKSLTQRLGPDEVRSHLGDLCGMLECHFLDLPVQLAEIAMRDHGTARTELVDELLELRTHPLVAA